MEVSLTILALENIRSLYNVGSIIRTASFFGIKKMLLVGFSGRTKPNINRLHPKVTKTALGADKQLKIEFLKDCQVLVGWAKKQNFPLISVERHKKSIDLEKWQPKSNQILVLGNEIDGVSKETLKASQKIVEIKRMGKKNSLNVAVAAGIILSQIRR